MRKEAEMSKRIQLLHCVLLAVGLAVASGCSTTTKKSIQPLSYVALERPTGPIKAEGQPVNTDHKKGGPYFLNFGFRPASDIAAYVGQAQVDSGATVLKNADVKLNVPFAFDILFFGFQAGADTLTANE